MNSIKDKIKKETIAIFTLSFVLLFMIVITVSYSYISSTTSESTVGNISARSVKEESLIFLKGEVINQLIDSDSKTHSAITRPVILYTPDSKKDSSSTTYNGYINIKNNTIVDTNLDSNALVLRVKKPDGTYVKTINGLDYIEDIKGFNITNKTGIFKFANNYEISAFKGNETIHTWEVEILISDLAVNINKNAGNEIDTDISFSRGEYQS